MKKILIILLIAGNFLAAQTIMIEVGYEREKYHIEKAWLIDKDFPATKTSVVEQKDDIVIELKNKNGTIVDQIRIENPRILRGVFPQEGNVGLHENFKDTNGTFIVRYPYKKELQYLNIVNAEEKNIQKKDSSTDTYSPPPAKKIKALDNGSRDMDFGKLLELHR